MVLWGFQEALQRNGKYPQLLVQENAARKLEQILQVSLGLISHSPCIISFSPECTITPDDLVVIHYSKRTQFCLHFFAKEITLEAFKKAEESTLRSTDWGKEVRKLTERKAWFKTSFVFTGVRNHQMLFTYST